MIQRLGDSEGIKIIQKRDSSTGTFLLIFVKFELTNNWRLTQLVVNPKTDLSIFPVIVYYNSKKINGFTAIGLCRKN